MGWGAAFVVIEGAALISKQPGATLSEHLRAWASLNGKGSAWQLRRVLLAAGLVWLAVHLFAG